ncbi:MAG: hydroxymethylbilane synthase [Candidatus Zixiibacteriota bacterium]
MNSKKIIIGTRGSDLALFQANFIHDQLKDNFDCESEIKIIKTTGDKLDQLSFDKMEGKGFFTKELEEALLNNEIDLAVHSLKDLMTTQPDGLKLGAVGFRADRRELLLVNNESFRVNSVFPVNDNCFIGTSSARRKCQIYNLNPTLKIKDLRGNVPTRVNKLRDKQYDAIIIASAGVNRLNLDLSDLMAIPLDPEIFLPAPAQGILGMQIRDNDPEVESIISKLNNINDEKESALERGLLKLFNSGCSLPLGVYSQIIDSGYRLKAILGQKKEKSEDWLKLRIVDITGDNIETLVNQAFQTLKT